LNDFHFVDRDRGILVGDKGTILATTDAGRTWTDMKSGSDWELDCATGRGERGIVVAGEACSILGNSDPFVTSIDNWDTPSPSVFHGLSNYPNPFRAGTEIGFEMQERSNATVIIVDCLGRRVRNLAAGTFNKGVYRLHWDGRDDHGSVVPPGAYFGILRTPSHLAVSRMLHVR
jgi:hypothetical protein